MADVQTLKRAVGLEAAGLVEAGMCLGLGTGSTVAFFLLFLAERLNRDGLRNVVCLLYVAWAPLAYKQSPACSNT